jgi:hypothetical protein
MKMKKIVLSIALLTVAGNIAAFTSDGGDVFIAIGGPGNQIPQDVLPSKAIQNEAAAIYKTVENLKVEKDGAAVQLPADFIEMIQNTFTVARTMASKEGKEIEQLHTAYIQIQYPYMRQQLISLMGNDRSFMSALATYDAAFQAHGQLCGQFWQDIGTRPGSNANFSALWQDISNGNETAAEQDLKKVMAPITATPAQEAAAQKDLTKLVKSSANLNKQLTALQEMFKNTRANKDLADHMDRNEYLVKQNVQWIIAFGMTLNPDFAKTINAETINTLKTTLTDLHTSPKVVALKKELSTIHAAKTAKR